MKRITVDGVEVTTSSLTQRTFGAAPCYLMVLVTPENQAGALNSFAEQEDEFSGLRVSGVADLGFLARFPSLRYLELVDHDRVDTRPLAALNNLRGLSIWAPGAGIDFSWFPRLEVFYGDWHPDNRNVDRCLELRQMRLWHYSPRSRSLEDLAAPAQLEWLTLTQTNVASLEGVGSVEDLRYLGVAYAPNLASLDAVAQSDPGIRGLEIRNARRIRSYTPLATMRRLRRLKLTACASMPDLRWTRGMDALRFISFVNTDVEDGDLSPLLELPSLRYVGTMDRKHHNLRVDALNDLLRKRAEGGPAHASKGDL